MAERKYYCAICENEWPSASIRLFEKEKKDFMNNIKKEFSFQCPICKAWLNGVVCPNCGKCIPPHENCQKCGSSLDPPLAGCRRSH